MKQISSLVASLTIALVSTLAGAQSRSSFAFVAAGNTDLQPDYFGFASDFSATGGLVSTSGAKSFTGMDSSGIEQTMTLAGAATAQSDYGRLRARANASLTNSYYNPDNTPYFDTNRDPSVDDDGSPNSLYVAGFATFTDELIYGGTAAAGYRASYRFFVTGSSSGGGVDAFVNVRIGSNANESFSADLSSGMTAQYFTTGKYAIDGNRRQTATASLTAQYRANTFELADGTDLTGAVDFSSTATLDAIYLYDGNDNLVAGYTVAGASGTTYPGSPVPEPATIAALGLGAAAILRRRRR